MQAKQANEAITVTLPDGAQKAGVKFATTPLEIALGISKGLADKVPSRLKTRTACLQLSNSHLRARLQRLTLVVG